MKDRKFTQKTNTMPKNLHLKKMVPFTVAAILFSQSLLAQKEEMNRMWGAQNTQAQTLVEGKEKLFDEGNFGMFIHWGLYSKLAGKWKGKTYYGIGEWIMNPRMANIPPKEYATVAANFNPIDFNAQQIAKLAKDAGMKYIIITSKHHDGFAMFDSKVDDFNIVDATPFARDPMKELSQACHENGLGFGFYYSHNQDWSYPGGTGGPDFDEEGQPVTFDSYFYKKCLPQVKEICTQYGDIDFIWFDTPGDMKKELVFELADMVRDLQPNAMLCSRVGYGLGDYVSKGDMEVPVRNIEGLWETCDTNNDSWSYAWYDNNFKSPEEIINRLVSTVARGGTYLFNVGPDGNGKIPEIGADFLREAGRWIQKYPQVVYGAGSSPWGTALAWGDITTKDSSLYLTVFDWPKDGQLYLPGLKSQIKSAQLLNGKHNDSLSFQQFENWTVVEVPKVASDTLASVIELQMEVDANDILVDKDLGVYPNVSTELPMDLAKVQNVKRETISWMEKFGEWKHANQVSHWRPKGKASWQVNVEKAGYYYLDICYKGNDRLVWKVTTDEGISMQNQQAATEKYNYYNMGIVEFKSPGKKTISVELIDGDSDTSSLKSVLIKPVF
ncbi:alpha-L-fucosidase [Marinilongibacter aquaticus]|uniref:alpha-L-fucosidase n=1 Tax=Marinilongibacter aquaticus TaxID=2975157 RepID=UPI0021BD1FF7|nr:alpha-L-fucosidase [Marinilongibacter aquaticus]UBM60749.1 alpha-L-fucosidase [Marinilongibacter aquaticus]